MNRLKILKTRKTLVLFFLFLLVAPNVFMATSTHKSRGGDYRGFLIAGERFLQGTFLYEGSTVATNVTWPPFFAAFIAPFTLIARISVSFSQVLWYVLNITLFFFSVGIWCRIIYAMPCGWLNEKKELSLYAPALIIPLVCVSGPLLDNFTQLQSSPLLLFLLTMGIDRLMKKRPWQAGFWFGSAVAIKAFPALMVIYLLCRKEGRAALSTMASGAVLTFVPVLRYGIHDYVATLKAWLGLSLSGGYPLSGLSQSVYAMIGRYVASNPFERMVRRFPSPPADDPGIIATTLLYRGLLVLCIAVVCWLLYRRKYRNIGVETSFFIVLMTVFSPISWRHYYVLMLPAWMVLTGWWFKERDRILKWTVLGSGFLISGLYLVGQIGKPVRGFLLCVVSNFTLGAFVILGGLLYCIVRRHGNENRAGIPGNEGNRQ
ncbi:MAG: DUF2029 domain-containing protein [Chitinispirillaceae bacterium]|nr:DUF2029 domain-containing protein [Chitinispirillaceae bacterium]